MTPGLWIIAVVSWTSVATWGWDTNWDGDFLSSVVGDTPATASLKVAAWGSSNASIGRERDDWSLGS